ncbi:MAG: PorV/PorQ family protein [Ignavibacteriales bacterium]|nr:PorV/PorQ family protein [Ignavibacteriales bacterium]MBK7379725.1 PorV/PorQ family protein [Ignavibacteriales bacterium]
MFKKIFVSTVLLFSLTQLNAQTVIAKYAGEFMAIGVGGRALGMGGAFTAFANDVTSGYYNPAGLAHLNYPQISLMHAEQFGDLVNYDYGAVAIPFGTDMSFGLSVMRLGVDGIPDTRSALYDANGDGITDIRDDRLDYGAITEFSNQDWAFYLTFAKRHSEDFYWGANIKVIRRNIAEFTANGIGFDIGALYTPMENLWLGANLQDATTTLVSWSTGRNELVSPTLKLGAAYGLDILWGRLTPAVDFDIRFENRQFASYFNIGPVSFDTHTGFEYNYGNLVFIRAGYNDVKQFTVGAGVKLPKLNLDYSFARFSSSEIERLPDTHRISLILTLEQPKFLREGL